MIVQNNRNGQLLLITQPDHAALSARLVSAWDLDSFAPVPSRETVLEAIAEHDNGWREIDAMPKVNPETSRPYDFMTLPTAVKQAIWPRGVRRLAEMSPSAAALVARHGLWVHGHRRGDPEWDGFFAEIEALMEQLLAGQGALDGAGREAFERSYDLLNLADLFSLVFCNRWTDPMDARGYRVSLDGNTLTISPDPFRGHTLTFTLAARAIADRDYCSDEDLQAAWAGATLVTLGGTARGAAMP
jgi:hypothetical protein